MSSVLRHSGFQPATQRPMVGDTKTSMVRADHLGWMLCDGRELSTAEYRTLFAVLGYDFGGDFVSTFKLPDARGHVMGLINVDNEYKAARTDISGWVDGSVSGEEWHTLTIAEMPAHNHDISGGYLNVSGGIDPSGNGQTSAEATGIILGLSGEHTHSSNSTSFLGLMTQSGNNTMNATVNIGPEPDLYAPVTALSINSTGTHSHDVIDPTHRHQIASNGGSLPHNNMQPTVFLGNLFIYSGRINQNVTGFNGSTTPTANPSYYPPQQNKRLY